MEAKTLERYKGQLLDIRARLIKTVDNLEQALVEDTQPQAVLSNVPTHLADIAAESLDKTLALAQNEEGMLERVEASLVRIEEGSYGTCEACGKSIPTARLDAIPYATRCVQCEEQRENSEASSQRAAIGMESKPWHAAT